MSEYSAYESVNVSLELILAPIVTSIIKVNLKNTGEIQMTDILDYHKQGYNCAESVVKAFNAENGLNIPVSIASPFGTGMVVGTTCGAITGAIIALGSIKGREEATVRNESRKYTKEIMNKIKEKYGTYECLELKKKGVSCNEIIEYTYNILRECL